MPLGTAGVDLPEGFQADVKARDRIGSETAIRLDTVSPTIGHLWRVAPCCAAQPPKRP